LRAFVGAVEDVRGADIYRARRPRRPESHLRWRIRRLSRPAGVEQPRL